MIHSPTQVPALAGVPIRAISSGSNQNVAISRSGELYSWGFGEMGQLCNGRAADEKLPTLVGAQASCPIHLAHPTPPPSTPTHQG